MARPKAFSREKAQMQAMQLFWRKGYAATSIEDLVETLKLSRSSLYDTFGDKRTLFLEVLKLYSERVISRIARTLEESPSPTASIQTIFDGLILGVGTETGAMGCFMVNSVAELVPYDSDVTRIATEYSETLQRLFTEAFEAAQDKVTTTPPPAQLAAYVFNAMQGMRILIKSGATREQVQSIIGITMQALQ
jgi:TetR/AcrR family transcriptional regulator, transcriptional repressor for nem operon